MYEWEGTNLLRVSIGPYNDEDDVDRLVGAALRARVRERTLRATSETRRTRCCVVLRRRGKRDDDARSRGDSSCRAHGACRDSDDPARTSERTLTGERRWACSRIGRLYGSTLTASWHVSRATGQTKVGSDVALAGETKSAPSTTTSCGRQPANLAPVRRAPSAATATARYVSGRDGIARASTERVHGTIGSCDIRETLLHRSPRSEGNQSRRRQRAVESNDRLLELGVEHELDERAADSTAPLTTVTRGRARARPLGRERPPTWESARDRSPILSRKAADAGRRTAC